MEETAVFTVEGIRRFHSWTHSCLSLLLDHVATIPAGEYTQELAGFGAASVRNQVIHAFNCEGFWVQLLQGLAYEDRAPAECPTVAEARRLQEEVRQRTEGYFSRVSDQQINAGMELHFPDGDVAVRTPALVLHHVFTHAFHHKGQIVAMCRILGYPAPDTDLNQFE